ncbi:MAG: WG repeat-containing protein [Clostridia bacterium]|nr:WG repeat-containing protein [Clostridia bacterium]
MKRNFIIRNVVLGIIIVTAITLLTYYFIDKINKEYEIEKVENYEYFVLKTDEKYGIIDKNGNIVIESKYDDIKIPNPSKAVFICYTGETSKVLNEQGKEILTNYKKIEAIRLKNIASNLMYEKSVLKYEENGKCGLINYQGKKITKAIYDSIEGLPYKEGELVVKDGEKLGVINIKGKKIVSAEYDKISVDAYYTDENGYRYSGYIVTEKTKEGYRYGYISYKGKELVKPEYNEMSRITEIDERDTIYLITAKDGQYGLLKNEKKIIENEYQSMEYDENNNVLIVEKNKKYGVSSLDGNNIVPTKYEQIDMTGIYIYAKNSQGVVVYNSNGTEANIDKNIAILNTSNEKYKIKINNEKEKTLYGVIGQDGKQIIDEKYGYIEYLRENYFIVSNQKSKLGVIDNKENEKISIENDSIQRIEGSQMLQTTIGNTTKLYAPNLEMLCEMENASIEVKQNYIKIYTEEETKYFSKEGKAISNKDVFTENNLFAKKENGKWGFENRSGEMTIKAKYDKVTEFNKYGYASVQKDGLWGAINTKGEEIVEPKYKFNEKMEPSFINKYYQVTYGHGEEYYTNNNI